MDKKQTEAAARRQATGQQAEDRALAYLEHQGLSLVRRHYQVARGPGRLGGEIDLIMQDRDGTLVFVEVRARVQAGYGGAAASVNAAKQRRLIWTAQHYLRGVPCWPPCRFDVVAITAGVLEWLPAAFEVQGVGRL
ncbi:MAG: hypothetical protein RLZZ494_2261 [Pseudomonadota bacterium]|jgi:putative endonuclease